MPVVTLLTDWGTADHYVAAVKGALLSRIPQVSVVDISHNIRLFDIKHAAFVMRNAWRHFPEGTIHIIAIDSIESDEHPHVAVRAEGHYFIGADTGLLSLILDKEPDKIIALNIIQDSGYFTFPTLNRFVKAAMLISQAEPLDSLGETLAALTVKTLAEPVFDGRTIYGRVMHIDRYENVFVNISDAFVRELIGKRPFHITFKRVHYPPLVKAYADVHEGDVCALFASNGLLQIAVNRGKAASLFGLNIDSEVLLEVDES